MKYTMTSGLHLHDTGAAPGGGDARSFAVIAA